MGAKTAKVELKIERIVMLEQALLRYESIRQAKLGYGLGRNLTAVKAIMDDVRKRLEGSEKLRAYNGEREKLIRAERGKQADADLVAQVEALKDKHGVREEIDDLAERERQLLEESETVELRRVSLALEPGFGEKDDAGQGVLSAGDRRLFLEVGLMYDPEDEGGKAEEKAAPPTEAK